MVKNDPKEEIQIVADKAGHFLKIVAILRR